MERHSTCGQNTNEHSRSRNPSLSSQEPEKDYDTESDILRSAACPTCPLKTARTLTAGARHSKETTMVDRRLGITYGSMVLFQSMLHNVFLLYHVEVFVSIYKIDKMSFWVGEVIFLAWNSFNDPLFGWMSDKRYLYRSDSDDGNVVIRRLRALQWNAPLFGLSFLAFWVSWINPSIQFVICLCLYDGFLTMIDLHHSALLADLTVSAETRTTLNSYCSIFSALGSLSVFMSYAAWNSYEVHTFQMFCVCCTIVSIIGFVFTTQVLLNAYRSKRKNGSSQSLAGKKEDIPLDDKQQLKYFIKQLSGHHNFLWFSLMNLIQVFHCHFNSNFFPLFLESLLGQSVSPAMGSVLLGVSFVAPHLNNLYFLSLCRRFGSYRVIKGLFCLKLALSVFMYMLGPNHLVLLCLFIASNRVFTEGTCNLLTLVISDLVDEDYVIHQRHNAVSALIFGTAALLSKPGQTLAPLIGTWLLSVMTGHDIFESGHMMGKRAVDTSTLDSASVEAYRSGVFTLLVAVPIVCAIIQLAVWTRFTLRGKRLDWVKSLRDGAKYTHV